jgi:NTE family protein
MALAQVKTRLKRLEPEVQERLVNWGYAICDVAMRRWVDPAAPAPGGFPYPEAGLG